MSSINGSIVGNEAFPIHCAWVSIHSARRALGRKSVEHVEKSPTRSSWKNLFDSVHSLAEIGNGLEVIVDSCPVALDDNASSVWWLSSWLSIAINSWKRSSSASRRSMESFVVSGRFCSRYRRTAGLTTTRGVVNSLDVLLITLTVVSSMLFVTSALFDRLLLLVGELLNGTLNEFISSRRSSFGEGRWAWATDVDVDGEDFTDWFFSFLLPFGGRGIESRRCQLMWLSLMMRSKSGLDWIRIFKARRLLLIRENNESLLVMICPRSQSLHQNTEELVCPLCIMTRDTSIFWVSRGVVYCLSCIFIIHSPYCQPVLFFRQAQGGASLNYSPWIHKKHLSYFEAHTNKRFQARLINHRTLVTSKWFVRHVSDRSWARVFGLFSSFDDCALADHPFHYSVIRFNKSFPPRISTVQQVHSTVMASLQKPTRNMSGFLAIFGLPCCQVADVSRWFSSTKIQQSILRSTLTWITLNSGSIWDENKKIQQFHLSWVLCQ